MRLIFSQYCIGRWA